MIQEYLFIDDTNKTEIEAYEPIKASKDIYKFDNSDCWIATYSVPGENEDGAKILSDINDYITNNFSPTVLSNGSSAYYNKTLFPFINEFERKLRKLLYLKSALNKGDEIAENIYGLENKDLGEIFTLIFTDDNFVKKVRATVNDKSWAFTKDEIIKSLNLIEENTRWDILIGADAVSELRENFISAKIYRNDTMHAHNINTKTYKDAKKLFKKINEQLDEEIGKIIEIAEEEPEKMTEAFNAELKSAMRLLDSTKEIINIRDIISKAQPAELLAIKQQIADMSSAKEILGLQQQLAADMAEVNALKIEIADIIKNAQSPAAKAIQNQLREITAAKK